MSDVRISDDILYIGVDDGDLDLFESQYEVLTEFHIIPI